MKFFLLSQSHHRLTLLTLLSLRLAAGRETELVTFRFAVLRRVHAVHKKTVQAVQSWLKRKERKGGGGGGAARFQTDAQDVQGQSPWQQDSPFITSMKLEGRWKWLRRLSHCSWHVQLQRDYTHKRTVLVFRVAVTLWVSEGKYSRRGCCSLHARARWVGGCSGPRWSVGRITPRAKFSVLAEPLPAFYKIVLFKYMYEPSNLNHCLNNHGRSRWRVHGGHVTR